MCSFALFRLPHSNVSTLVVQHEGQPDELCSPADLCGRKGFVMAPFAADSDTPLLLLRPDYICQLENDHISLSSLLSPLSTLPSPLSPLPSPHFSLLSPLSSLLSKNNYETYGQSFDCFYDELQSGRFQKLVLARCKTVRHQGQCSPLQLYLTAARSFPRLFVALVSMPRCGTWLIATPETLLSGQDGIWSTMALAGTQKLTGDDLLGEGEHIGWDQKNIREQHLVASYIANRLQPFARQLRESGPRTVRAANLVHLRTDFTFSLADEGCVGHLLQALHPTPAVSGLPKEEACQFILDHEPAPRRYYSGFMGPLLMPDTHLYVSLRCMEIGQDAYCLHAGGGLVIGSQKEKEWLETEAKMETMNRCISEACPR